MLYPQTQIFKTQLLPAQIMQKILVLRILDDDCWDKQSWVAGIDSFVVLQDKLAKENDNGCQIFCCFFPAVSGKVSIAKPKDPSWEILILHL